jgi:hypothetical protein
MPAKKTLKKKSPVKLKKKATKPAKKASPSAVSVQPAKSGFQQSYINLRKRLDAIEIGALHYLLSGETDGDKNQRAQQLMEMLADASAQITALHRTARPSGEVSTVRSLSLASATEGDTENPCPEGWYFCEGA